METILISVSRQSRNTHVYQVCFVFFFPKNKDREIFVWPIFSNIFFGHHDIFWTTDTSLKTLQSPVTYFSTSYMSSNCCNCSMQNLMFSFSVKLLFANPRLAMACFFGPCTPYQYRLQGPGKWREAPRCILTQWERTLYPLKTRPLKNPPRESQALFFLFYLVLLGMFTLVIHFLFMRWFQLPSIKSFQSGA